MTQAALLAISCSPQTGDAVPSAESRDVAAYAVSTYGEAAIETLADLVAFRTVHQEGIENAGNPEFRAMTAHLGRLAADLGLDFADHGVVVVIGLGAGEDRLGVVVHGDVQPADSSRWAGDAFELDLESEPGRLVGRGTEDDKGPLVCALYALKALKDSGMKLRRRVELIIAYTEESDWDPLNEFFASWEAPQLNVAFDADYPVVIAEKGWGSIELAFAEDPVAGGPRLAEFTGGSFLSQVPELARAVIEDATPELEAKLRHVAGEQDAVSVSVASRDGRLEIEAQGLSAHSGQPWAGRNAITHLAALLGHFEWPASAASRMMRLVNDLVGTGDYGEQFGDLAHSDPFMGPLTLTLATLESSENRLVAGINIRRPVGRSSEEIERSLRLAVEAWALESGHTAPTMETDLYEPYYLEDAPQVPVLLDVFRHYTGAADAEPIAIGGSTNAQLLPYGVTFGPSMPGATYTGHSEHEFIARDQYLLNLEMYTAALAELAGSVWDFEPAGDGGASP